MDNYLGAFRVTQDSQPSLSKQEYRSKKLTGVYKEFFAESGQVKEEGRFQNGLEAGLWKQYDKDGDEIHYQFSYERVGAICGDGSRSYATGRGACSWHGGVAEWVHQNKRYRVGGTGKNVPIEKRISNIKQVLREKIPSDLKGLELDQLFFKQTLTLLNENKGLEKKAEGTSQKLLLAEKELKQAHKKLENSCNEIERLNKKLEEMKKKLEKPSQKDNMQKSSDEKQDKETEKPKVFEKKVKIEDNIDDLEAEKENVKNKPFFHHQSQKYLSDQDHYDSDLSSDLKSDKQESVQLGASKKKEGKPEEKRVSEQRVEENGQVHETSQLLKELLSKLKIT